VRVITIGALKRFWERHPDSQGPLKDWYAKTGLARWKKPPDVKDTFRQVDFVRVRSGNAVFVFNITRACRLIAAVHFDYPRVFVWRILTHRDYDSNQWKEQL
jgi:mRNA interferase HigB